jgi:hypothetical protein
VLDLRPLLTGDGQHVVLHRNVDVLLVDARQLGGDHHFAVRLVHLHGGHQPAAAAPHLATAHTAAVAPEIGHAEAAREVAEDPVDPVVQLVKGCPDAAFLGTG